MRNILVNLRTYLNKKDTIYLDMLLEAIENELKTKKSNLQYELKEINDNLKLLEEIKNK